MNPYMPETPNSDPVSRAVRTFRKRRIVMGRGRGGASMFMVWRCYCAAHQRCSRGKYTRRIPTVRVRAERGIQGDASVCVTCREGVRDQFIRLKGQDLVMLVVREEFIL